MELGSEYALPVTADRLCSDNIFQYLNGFHTFYTDSGRTATRLLNPSLPCGAVLLPSYICESVLSCFSSRDMQFYRVTEDIGVDWDDLFSKINEDTGVVYLHYFNGVLPPVQRLKQLLVRKANLQFTIVEDTTHSIFSSALTVGDYGICSLRKWFPIPDGGVLYGKQPLPVTVQPMGQASWVAAKTKAMTLKGAYLCGQADDACNEEYRRLFADCDEVLEQQTGTFAMSDISTEILQQLSVSSLIGRRQENIRFLRENLQDMGLTPFAQTRDSECPLVCPVKLEQRDHLRAFLMTRRIYCAVHWPVAGTPLALMAEISALSNHELSLPIDQRYSRDELMYLVDSIRQYKEL